MTENSPTDTDSTPSVGTNTMRVDPVTLELIRNACTAVGEEMNATLVRTSYSPNIKERRDCSCALFDADAEMISQAENIPVHLGAMPFSVRAAVERHPPETLSPGDAILLNDPFEGGAHLPDLTLVTPIFHEGDLIAYAANRAHHADIGGSHAGSVSAAATEIYEEGVRIPPVKLYEAGDRNQAVFELLFTNVRTPDERRGDLRAQEAANETGRRRFRDLVDDYGHETTVAALAEIKAYSERRMRSEISELPDGTYQFSDSLDDDGQGNEDLTVAVTITIDGASLTVDFTGTAPQTDGPVNAVRAVTASATYYALRCVTDPEIPPNHGCYRPVELITPAKTIVNPTPPAAVVGGNLETSQRVTDVVLGAMSKAVPGRVTAAGQGTMNNITFGGHDPITDQPYTFYETQAGGFGARPTKDGLDGVHVHMSNTLNTPVEVLETAYPLRVVRYLLRQDSGGAGRVRGGLGIRRDIQVRGHTAQFSLLADRHQSRPYGLDGGGPGAPGAAYRVTDDEQTKLPAKTTLSLQPSTVISLRTPGGGGIGSPQDRDPSAVRADLQLEKISAEHARTAYGLSPGGDPDPDPDPNPDPDTDPDPDPDPSPDPDSELDPNSDSNSSADADDTDR